MRSITEEEVEKAVKKMKTGKAVGVDELSVEMVKANRLVGIKWLTSCLMCAHSRRDTNRVAKRSDCANMEWERGHP